MNAPNSTPILLSAFDDADTNPGRFLDFLKNLTSQYLGGEATTRIPSVNKDTWVTIVIGLKDLSLASFPMPNAVKWRAIQERAMIVQATLEVIHRVFVRVDGIYVNTADLVKKTLARVLSLCRVLDLWMDTEVSCEDNMLTPAVLSQKAISVVIGVLRGLGGSIFISADMVQPPWKTLQSILDDCLQVIHDLIARSLSISFPVTLALFQQPRFVEVNNVFNTNHGENQFHLEIDAVHQVPMFLALMMDVMVQTVCPELLCHWFITDLLRRISESARNLFDHLISPTCPTTSTKRARALKRLLSSIAPLSRIPNFQDPIHNLTHRLLRYRLEQWSKPGWEVIDPWLAYTFESDRCTPSSKLDIFASLQMLRKSTQTEGGQSLRSVLLAQLRGIIQCAEDNDLQMLKDKIALADLETDHAALLALIDDRKSMIMTATSSIPIVTEESAFNNESARLHKIRSIVEEIITPNEINWMDDDLDRQFAVRALEEIQSCTERVLPASDRISFAEKFADLLCLFSSCNSSNCLSRSNKQDLIILNSSLAIASRLLVGNATQVTSGVRQRVYVIFSRIINHHDMKLGGLDSGISKIFQGIRDTDRGVRLSAGFALCSLVHAYIAAGDARSAELIFERLYDLLEDAKNPIRETILIAVHSMGKTTNTEVLGQVICLFIAQLGRPNPVIKGMAFMQIHSLTKYHAKTPYTLILPYMDQVAPFVVSQITIQPNLLVELCRLMSIAPADFITITLPRTLPRLFADCNLKVLEAIARQVSQNASSLLLKHSHEILAHILLLKRPNEINKAFDFILRILRDASHTASIEIQSVVKSCTIPLLAELVFVMGDENDEVAQTGVSALKKVERLLLTPVNKGRVLPVRELGAFLKSYMLGLISLINDMLQDVQGKKSVMMKRKILRSLGSLITHIGPTITNVAPQIMATFQTMVGIPELTDVTLDSWYAFLTTLGPKEVGPHVGPTTAAFIALWPVLSEDSRRVVVDSIDYIVSKINLGPYLDDIVDFSAIPEFNAVSNRVKQLRRKLSPKEQLRRLLERSSSENLTVVMQSLGELKEIMLQGGKDLVRELASGDMFDPMVGQIVSSLFSAACRDGEGTEGLRLIAYECIGILGAVDPDRCEIDYKDPGMVVLSNFADEGESVAFALHLIQSLLVGAFRSTSDIKYQSHLAYSIQELLRFCQFTPALVAAGNNTTVPLKVRNRWSALPKHVLETVTPLLEARFTLSVTTAPHLSHPIYPNQTTYREWIQLWTTHLITKASGNTAQAIFGVFRSAVRNKDVVVAHHLLPHLVLNILISGDMDDAQAIRFEMLAVLDDQVDVNSNSTSDKKLLSAQAVFMLLDHLNRWVRMLRQRISAKKNDNKRARANQVSSSEEEQLLRVDSILLSIDHNLMARAALQCKAYARSLMNFERQIVSIQAHTESNSDLPGYYEKLHEIYAHLDEPDGMEGVSTLILSPSLEHRIREHESTGRWTAAQSCWEVRLQQAPDNVEFHLGLLRCLRNLGHYDTLRTHVKGVLIGHPEWESALAGYQVESAWMVGDWDDVQTLVDRVSAQDVQTAPIVKARLLLAMRTGNRTSISESISQARAILGAPIAAAGVRGYRRSYDAVLDLHLTHELELIHNTLANISTRSQTNSQAKRRQILLNLSRTLSARLDATFPTFRSREPILSMRRTAFALTSSSRRDLLGEIGRSWLASAKIGRKAAQWQTAYSAMLQAQQSETKFSFMESAKLIKATGEPLRALQDLENSMKLLGLLNDNPDVVDLTVESDTIRTKAKGHILRARWMNESDRFEMNIIYQTFLKATELQPEWESAHFHLGQFHDECFKSLPTSDQVKRGVKMNLYTVRSFAKAIKFGSKYVYQMVPRLITIWLDLGENRAVAGTETFKRLNDIVAKAIKEVPVYKWFTAFPQIVSRVGHSNLEVYKHLSRLISRVLEQYPKQALWLFASVVKSTKLSRSERGAEILDVLRNNPQTDSLVPDLISQSLTMTNELLALCDHPITEEKTSLSMSKDFPRLAAFSRSDLIIPLQESLTASLPSTSTLESEHQPFPANAPTFEGFAEEIDIMRSLARPRKITIRGSDGQIYMFLGKPKDDLRKDARLMDFNAIINKLLKANFESRRRQLHIRTYGVVTLNEECGFIQWVPNTVPMRPVLIRSYEARRIKNWSGELGELFKRIKDAPEKTAAELFSEKVLPTFPPVFHEWFIETFPEPTAWLASRITYSRTAAVMSMVGFILGLGDRHCENILLDTNTGDTVHVDFNCLFEKGKTLETPERIPFRLTQNIIDGMGVTGVEGVFRIACEVTMQLLRDNKDSLMSVLDAFIHDPIVEWEDEKRKLEREPSRRNQVKASVDLRMLAKNALNPIEKKLKGIYTTSKERQEREISTSNLVQMLIQEATSPANLSKMYPGWAPWH